MLWETRAHREEAPSRQRQHNTELQGQEDPAQGACRAGLDSCQIEEWLPGAATERGKQLFVGAALVQQFVIEVVLHFGEPVPFSTLQSDTKNPEQSREN